MYEHWADMMNEMIKAVDNPFISCGIVNLTYHKNNKQAQEIYDAAFRLRHTYVKDWFINYFNDEQRSYYESIGCPFEATWQQDKYIQEVYCKKVVDFAKEHKVNMNVLLMNLQFSCYFCFVQLEYRQCLNFFNKNKLKMLYF